MNKILVAMLMLNLTNVNAMTELNQIFFRENVNLHNNRGYNTYINKQPSKFYNDFQIYENNTEYICDNVNNNISFNLFDDNLDNDNSDIFDKDVNNIKKTNNEEDICKIAKKSEYGIENYEFDNKNSNEKDNTIENYEIDNEISKENNDKENNFKVIKEPKYDYRTTEAELKAKRVKLKAEQIKLKTEHAELIARDFNYKYSNAKYFITIFQNLLPIVKKLATSLPLSLEEQNYYNKNDNLFNENMYYNITQMAKDIIYLKNDSIKCNLNYEYIATFNKCINLFNNLVSTHRFYRHHIDSKKNKDYQFYLKRQSNESNSSYSYYKEYINSLF